MGINMPYCRHENTSNALQQVIDEWDEYDKCKNDPEDADPSEHEERGRRDIIEQSVTLLEKLGFEVIKPQKRPLV